MRKFYGLVFFKVVFLDFRQSSLSFLPRSTPPPGPKHEECGFRSPRQRIYEIYLQISYGIATQLKESVVGLEKSPRPEIKSVFERSVRDTGTD